MKLATLLHRRASLVWLAAIGLSLAGVMALYKLPAGIYPEMEFPRIAPLVPFLSTVGVLRVLGMSLGPPAGSLAPSVQAAARATSYRTAAYHAAADELRHVRDSAAEVKATRRPLTIPLVVVTGGRGSDAAWRDLQRDQVTLSRQGCQIVAEESGHVVGVSQPQAVVDAVRTTVDVARGSKLAPCG